MAKNRGKQFENVIREAFEKVPGVSIDRLHDQTTGYKGSQNICDFIVYREPYEYYFECKSIHGASLPFSNITETQWNGLLEKSKIEGVFAGVICWWIDKNVTKFIPIFVLEHYRLNACKSIRFDDDFSAVIEIKGKKKRVFFDYDMERFLDELGRVSK
jgi:penicillin-binding protein-related factor A (putative recombinase)